MTAASQAIALNRFGLGARAGEAAPTDPKAWLNGQLKSFDPRPPPVAAAPSRATVAGHLADYFAELRDTRQQAGSMGQGQTRPDTEQKQAMQAVRKDQRRTGRADYLALVGARATTALTSPSPFAERLTHFWANHFAVSADKLTVVGMAGLLEFEAIRPNVMGKFSDMALAVEQHPAILLYLDQAQSIGPDSVVGARIAARGQRKVGLNENLAREIMELHTLGVRTGYTQADVTEFARALTGWTVSGIGRGPGARLLGVADNPGQFAFLPTVHQPGTRTIIGKTYAEGGEAQARDIISDFCASPATAAHIATKLARHFAGDAPPVALVQRLSTDFRRTGGDLPSLYETLIESPELWTAPEAKFKSPWDWMISSSRALGFKQLEGQQVVGLMQQLGQPVWRPVSPAGYDDLDASWAGPDALVRRVEAAERLAARAPQLDARALAPQLLPGTLTSATAQAIARADSPAQATALLLVAPEFMRR
ncbi:DUF1800 domain-containing protein [Sphingomonas antarctica]|uniref:DUF1800 domain-containing protein n=1 Tax=Sphingomonas antarctica TaxID=2040274 RepID=UPI0039E820BD